MKKSLSHSDIICTTLENLHRRLCRVEKAFLGVSQGENPEHFDSSHGSENPFHSDNAHRQNGVNPYPVFTQAQKERVVAAYNYMYPKLFSDDNQTRLWEGFMTPAPNQGFHLIRTPLATELYSKFINDALGRSIDFEDWMQTFYDMSHDRSRRKYNSHAGLLMRDMIVRALIDAGMLRKDDSRRILFMETD